MKKIIMFLSVLFVFISTSTPAEENVLLADFRQRPPEMIVEGQQKSGPLKDILEEAAKKIGYNVKWRTAPFPRSLHELKLGKIDILPRTVKTEKREAFVNFLGPIGYQEKNILFLVKKGQENLINRYEDLNGLTIAVKRKAAYFKRFNEDTSLKKQESRDDENMVRMFAAGRFDTMAVLDPVALETALAKRNITNYAFANYKYQQRSGNYYGMSKKSSNAKLYQQLNQSLLKMAKSGRVTEIYQRYGITPPLQD